eukprot:Rhum_TRINITY_DN25856_c0_g1::Rhum_TRINITY_DN25856_c0_g1_i1::g.182906::m.182906
MGKNASITTSHGVGMSDTHAPPHQVTETVVAVLKGHEGSIRQVVYDDVRQRCITGSDDKTCGMYDLSPVNFGQGGGSPMELQPHYLLKGPKHPVSDIALIREDDGKWHSLYAIVKDRAVFHWTFLADSKLQKLGDKKK